MSIYRPKKAINKIPVDPNVGVFTNSGFYAQYLLAPLGLERGIIEHFKDSLEKTMYRFTQIPFKMALGLYEDRGARTLKGQVDSILSECQKPKIERGYVVLILPPSAKPDLHNFIKKRLWEKGIFCQCVLADKLSKFYEEISKNGKSIWVIKRDLKGKYISYLRNTALGHLIVNRKWGWVLDSALNYDVYIGIDVKNNTAAFTFLYEGGKHCYMRVYESKQKEKLLARQTREISYKHLEEDLKCSTISPRSIIIHRDGKAYPTEGQGFQEAIQQLQNEGIIPRDVKIGMVEVQKSNATDLKLVDFRAIGKKEGNYINPQIGSWHDIGDNEGIICNTGWPFQFKGTVRPLYIQIKYGSLDIEKVLQDIFDLSQLCWMSPDKCIRLPITLKLCDDFLQAVAADADEDEAIYGEEELEEEESFNNVIPFRKGAAL